MVSLAEVSNGRWYEITNVNLSTSYWAFNIWDGGVVVGSNYSSGSGHNYNSPFDMPLFTKSTTISSLTGIPLLTAPTQTVATIYIDSTGGGQIIVDGITGPSQVVRSIGSAITFTAKPISGYAFQKWQVYVNNALYKEYTTNPITLTVDRNYSITGVFIQDQTALCCPDGWTIDSTGICNSPSGESAEPPHYCSLGGVPVSQAPPTSLIQPPIQPPITETGEVFVETYRGYTINKQVFSSGAVAFYVYLNGIDQYGNLKTLAEARAYVDILVAKPPPIVDKYYDCVSGKCIEKVGGKYKNDLKCGGKCVTPDNTGTYLLLGAIALGVMMFMKKRR